MIPGNFEQWKHCITEECGIDLNPGFAGERLLVYTNPEHPETRNFVRLYGEEHLRNIINWFSKI